MIGCRHSGWHNLARVVKRKVSSRICTFFPYRCPTSGENVLPRFKYCESHNIYAWPKADELHQKRSLHKAQIGITFYPSPHCLGGHGRMQLSLELDEFVVFDLETTGLSPWGGDEIIEIVAVKIYGNQVDNENIFHSLINPK